MKLRCEIYDEPALLLETRAGPGAEGEIWRTPALRGISAGWDRPPDPHTIENWLRGAIPENGTLETFERNAGAVYADRGIAIGAGAMPDWIWANADWEYPGAVRFIRHGEAAPPARGGGWREIDHIELARRLREAAAEAERTRRGLAPPIVDAEHRNASLSGARGKIAVLVEKDGRMLLPRRGSLSTWIVKIEHRAQWPGEAGVESVCQRALGLLGIEAATTTAQIIDGIAVVMSKRSDRIVVGAHPAARHQEDWLQAFGRGVVDKYDRGTRSDSGYASLYAILRRYARDPGEETRRVTRVLGAACALVNGDLHRKNLAVQHAKKGEPFAVRLAPIYDFSSQAGVKGASDSLVIRIGGAWHAHQVDEAHWRRLAERSQLDVGQTLDLVREVVRDTPEALAEAAEQCRQHDEWHAAGTVRQRIDAAIRSAQRYARIITGGEGPPTQEETVVAPVPAAAEPSKTPTVPSGGPSW